jgi:oxygen-dependent protoporphyrinogen oxidase
MPTGIDCVAAPCIRPPGARNAAHPLFQQPARSAGAPPVTPAPPPATTDRPVVVVGGGIGGLTFATRLHDAGVPVRLLESSGRFGGVITSGRDGGWLFEYGPNTVMTSDPAVFSVLKAAGLEAEALVAGTTGARRFIVFRGRLALLPASPAAFLKSPIFSARAKLNLLGEPFRRRGTNPDESIADFVRRRLGVEFLDYAVGPFVSGVYAGDPERLSVRWAVRKVHALEVDHGSLIRGALAQRKRRGGAVATGPAGGLLSFPGGLATLPARLAERLGDAAVSGRRVTGLERSGAGWRVRAEHRANGPSTFDASSVVLALGAAAAARLVDPLEPPGRGAGDRAAALAALPTAGVLVTSLGFRRADVGHPLDGFGFLVPRVEGVRLLGTLFPSSLFPGRAPDGHVALTAISGGATDPGLFDRDDAAHEAALLDALAPLLDLRGGPVYRKTVRWPAAIPQYDVGHGRFLELADALEARHPGLHLLGNWRGGVSVPDRMARASELAARWSAAPS